MNNLINPNLPSGAIEGGWQKTVKNLSNLTTENKNKLAGIHILVLYSLASISLFFHMVQGIESGHRSLGILSQSNSLKIRYMSRFISIFFGLSYLIMTFYLKFK